MVIQNRLPKKYDPSICLTMIDGASVKSEQLSRDGGFENMEMLNILRVVQAASANTVVWFARGRPLESLEGDGTRLIRGVV